MPCKRFVLPRLLVVLLLFQNEPKYNKKNFFFIARLSQTKFIKLLKFVENSNLLRDNHIREKYSKKKFSEE